MMILALRRDSGGDDVVDSSFCPGGYMAWRDVDAARAGIEARAAQRGLTLTWVAGAAVSRCGSWWRGRRAG